MNYNAIFDIQCSTGMHPLRDFYKIFSACGQFLSLLTNKAWDSHNKLIHVKFGIYEQTVGVNLHTKSGPNQSSGLVYGSPKFNIWSKPRKNRDFHTKCHPPRSV